MFVAIVLVAVELLLFNQVRKALRGRPAIAPPAPGPAITATDAGSPGQVLSGAVGR